ncbi:formyltransferase family protein [Pseudobdellovibrio exovorus]|uniref:Methionyl-tRNA formyltransferase n=1 Tax=Pseudobdellovibrio exovorus JSS TaxID=1184267 RepID=M4VR85_9BACT|nr:formyltransferase family protein [Pseudobdellovibrio exovorus]AGH95689.1 hypothetical protein A11Q_1473 [Pseudobdellovibrio exovorus JSS]
MNFLVFSLGQKGYSVVKGLIGKGLNQSRLFVIVGTDKNVKTDYSDEVIELCQAHQIPFLKSNNCSVKDLPFHYSYAIAAGWRWMIRDIPENQLVVFHDSILPRYRGFAPLVSCLKNKDQEIGVTALWGNKDYDAGNILGQVVLKVDYPTTIAEQINRISNEYANLAVKVSEMFETQGVDLSGRVQNIDEISYSMWLDDEDYRIQWCDKSEEICHFISCVGSPFMGASTMMGSRLVRIMEAEVAPDLRIENRTPGKVFSISHHEATVVCGQGMLKVISAKYDDDQTDVVWTKIRTRLK